MKTNLFLTSLSIFAFTACGDSSGETTVVTTIITTNPGTDTSPSPGTSDATDTDDASTSTTDAIDPTGTAGTSTTDDLPMTTSGAFDCVGDDQCEPPTTPAPDNFCEYVATACAEHQIEENYCNILADKCVGTLGCTMCFELSNYCAQIGTNCDGLYLKCGCVAEMLGVE